MEPSQVSSAYSPRIADFLKFRETLGKDGKLKKFTLEELREIGIRAELIACLNPKTGRSNLTQTAKNLGTGRTALYRWMDQCRIPINGPYDFLPEPNPAPPVVSTTTEQCTPS